MGYLEDAHRQIIGEDHASLLKHIAILPPELKYIIWKMVPWNVKVWVTKKDYEKYHYNMLSFLFKETFMLRIIGADCNIPFFHYFEKKKKKNFFFEKKTKNKIKIFEKKVIYKNEIYHNIFHLYFTHAKRSHANGCLAIFEDYGFNENSFKQIKTKSSWTN